MSYTSLKPKYSPNSDALCAKLNREVVDLIYDAYLNQNTSRTLLFDRNVCLRKKCYLFEYQTMKKLSIRTKVKVTKLYHSKKDLVK